jgi:AcrR family transcriptional regulator
VREDTDQAILAATRELVVEQGVRKLTVEAVAKRSGVAKTTIYRRYRSKNDLALAVLLRMVEEVVQVPDLGDTRAELTAFVGNTVRILGSTLMGRVMQGLSSYVSTDPELAVPFREKVVGRRLAEVERLVGLGIKRGDLPPGTDAALVHEMLFGPVYYRLLLSGQPLNEQLAGRIVDAALDGLAA